MADDSKQKHVEIEGKKFEITNSDGRPLYPKYVTLNDKKSVVVNSPDDELALMNEGKLNSSKGPKAKSDWDDTKKN